MICCRCEGKRDATSGKDVVTARVAHGTVYLSTLVVAELLECLRSSEEEFAICNLKGSPWYPVF
jgi:hypothetical protein